MSSLCCLPWCRKPINSKREGRKFPPDRPTQLAWLDALDAGNWFSIPQETLSTGLVLCKEHFDSKGNVKRRYDLPYSEPTKSEGSANIFDDSADEEEGVSNDDNDDDDNGDNEDPSWSPVNKKKENKEIRINIVRTNESTMKRKSTSAILPEPINKQIKVELHSEEEYDEDCFDDLLNDSPPPPPPPQAGTSSKRTILDSIDSAKLSQLTKQAFRSGSSKKVDGKPSKRNSMSLQRKMEIIQLADKGLKQSQIARKLNLKKSTVWSAIAAREKIEEAYMAGSPLRKKLRKSTYDEINQALYAWYQKVTSQNLFVNTRVLLTMAENIANELGRTDFKGSPGWLERFKQRHNIRFGNAAYKPRKSSKKVDNEHVAFGEESQNVEVNGAYGEDENLLDDHEEIDDDNEDLRQSNYWLKHSWRYFRIKNEKSQEIYQEKDIYFAEELGILFRITPKQAWEFRHNSESTPEFSIADERITVLLCANSDGSDKRRLLVTGSNISALPNNLPADFVVTPDRSNWITKTIFMRWLNAWNVSLQAENRKIILLLNSLPTHTFGSRRWSNVKIVNIPTHHILELHPVNRGISKSFRSRYRRLFLEKLVNSYHDSLSCQSAIFMLSTAWNEMPHRVIRDAFALAGYFPQTQTEVSFQSDDIDCSSIMARAAELGFAMPSSKYSFLEYVGIDESLYAVECTVICNLHDTTTGVAAGELEIEDDELAESVEFVPNHCDATKAEAQNYLENLRNWAMARRSCPQEVHLAFSTLESFILGHS